MSDTLDDETPGAGRDRHTAVSAWNLPKSSLRLRPERVEDSTADVLKSESNPRSEAQPCSSGVAFRSAALSPTGGL